MSNKIIYASLIIDVVILVVIDIETGKAVPVFNAGQ